VRTPGNEPTHFATIARQEGVSDAVFSKQVGRFWTALRRRYPQMAYLAVSDFSGGVRHVHALIRVPGTIARQKRREAAELAGVRVSIKPIVNVVGAVRYVFGDLKDPQRQPELTPPSYKGRRMYTPSRGFLRAPMPTLWAEVKAERAERAIAATANDSTAAPKGGCEGTTATQGGSSWPNGRDRRRGTCGSARRRAKP
jgi:hypothetical protein